MPLFPNQPQQETVIVQYLLLVVTDKLLSHWNQLRHCVLVTRISLLKKTKFTLTLKKNFEKIVLINWKTFYFGPLAPPLCYMLTFALFIVIVY